MDEQTQEQQEIFNDTSLVKEAALVEAKKKTGEAKSWLHKLASAGKNQIKQELNPEDMGNKITSGIINKVKSASKIKGKGPRAKSNR